MTRLLTISSVFRKRMWMKPTIKPKLTIQGEWFEKAGFNIGDKIELQVINDQIIIQKV